eukprot:7117616-Prymnesium_polylepis.4
MAAQAAARAGRTWTTNGHRRRTAARTFLRLCARRARSFRSRGRDRMSVKLWTQLHVFYAPFVERLYGDGVWVRRVPHHGAPARSHSCPMRRISPVDAGSARRI